MAVCNPRHFWPLARGSIPIDYVATRVIKGAGTALLQVTRHLGCRVQCIDALSPVNDYLPGQKTAGFGDGVQSVCANEHTVRREIGIVKMRIV